MAAGNEITLIFNPLILQHSLAGCAASTHYLQNDPGGCKTTAKQLERDGTRHPDMIADVMMRGDSCRWKSATGNTKKDSAK